MNLPSELPIVQAPMAGGPSTPQLTAAVSAVGGYGFLAAGYLTPDALRALIDTTRELTPAPFGVNVFVPSTPGDSAAVAAYAEHLRPEAERLGVALGDPRWEDDAYEAKLEVIAAARVHMASFTFGCPTAEVVEQLHRAGIQSAVTVTSAAEARAADAVGADAIAVQGSEAGGHQASFLDLAANDRPLLATMAEARDVTALPIIATGGIMDGRDATAVLAAGADAIQIGTALLCTPEAGTSAPYRRALLEARYADTMLTRAFSGRFARGLANRFAREHSAYAPEAYPEVHHLTRPLRAAATRAGDPDVPNLWAGTGWRAVTAEAAADVVRKIAATLAETAR